MTSPDVIYLLKFTFVLFVTLIAVYLAYRFLSGYSFFTTKSKQIEIIDIRYISRNKGLMLVKIRKSMLLLSFDESGIRKLKEWQNENPSSFDNQLSDS